MFEEIFSQINGMTPAFIAGLGLSMGIQHAFEPDHIAAVSTQISSQSKKSLVRSSLTKSSLLGVIWGAGHTTTLILVGLVVYGLAITSSKEIFSGFEFIVGLMLIGLAVTTIFNKNIFTLKHKHPHVHYDGSIHFDEHQHNDQNHMHNHKSYFIGLIHGLAGSGTMVVMLAGLTSNLGMIIGFIAIFGIGSMIGMALIGGLIGIPFGMINQKFGKILRYFTGLFSLAIGISLVFQIGILQNLFRF